MDNMDAKVIVAFYVVVKVKHAKNKKRIEAKVKQAITETIDRMHTGIQLGAIMDGDEELPTDPESFNPGAE